MNMHEVRYKNKQRVANVMSDGISKIELCKIESINIAEMTASVQLIGNSQIMHEVPFCLPARFFDRGILYLPEEGALGVLVITEKKQPFIISFVSFKDMEEISEDLLPGEILIQSKGYSFIKEDNAGNLLLGSPAGNFIVVKNDNEITQVSSTNTNNTLAKEFISGIVNNVVMEMEKIYDSEPTSSLSFDEIVEKVMKNQEVSLQNPSPVIVIEKGNAVDESGQKVKLEIDSNPDNNYEIAYRITIKDQSGNEQLSMAIDKAGRAKIVGEKLILDFESVSLSGQKLIQDFQSIATSRNIYGSRRK